MNILLREKLLNSNPSNLTLDFTKMSNGVLPGGLIGNTWSILSGKAVNNPTLLPTELLVNGGFDSDTGSWTGTDGTIASVSGGQIGNCCQLTRTGGTSQLVRQAIASLIGQWIMLIGWLESGTSGNELGGIVVQQALTPYNIESSNYFTSSAIWQKAITTGLVSKNSMFMGFQKISSTSGTMLFDTASAKQIVLSSIFSTRLFSSTYGTVKASWIQGMSGCPFGIVMCLDNPYNPHNYVVVYYRRHATLIKMDKCVNGVYTNLLSVTVVYDAGKNVMLKRIPNTNTFQAWYGVAGAEVQVGTDQTINDSSITNNKYHGLFDTSPQLNTCSSFSYAAVG